jgi:DNA methyltransferase 1-associated protein 1
MGLCHWWKRHDNPDDYSFARFNKRPRMVRYSKEEYDMHIKGPGGDKGVPKKFSLPSPSGPPCAGQSSAGRPPGSKEDWSKEETDHLFELCERFELKWVVIEDRYQSYPVPLPPRSIEDIKARYYPIVKKLKPQMLPEQMVLDEGSGANAFRRVQGCDPEYDWQRKAKLAAYYGRSTKQEQIDNRTIEEAKAIENSVRATALRFVAHESAAW